MRFLIMRNSFGFMVVNIELNNRNCKLMIGANNNDEILKYAVEIIFLPVFSKRVYNELRA